MNKSLSYVNLSLELHVASTFWLGSNISGTFSLYFVQQSSNHMNSTWDTRLEDAHTLVQNWHLKQQTFCKSILDVKQSFSSFTSLFVSSRLAWRSSTNSLFPSWKAMFFWGDPQCFGPLGKFEHNMEIYSFKNISYSM